jgi:TonB family protein
MKVLLFALLLGIPLATQSATVSGDVRDPSGGLLPGVTVTLTSTAGQKSVTTDARGRFSFTELAAGDYEISASVPGFKTSRNRVPLSANQSVATTIQMAIGSLSESITVVAPRQTASSSAPATVTPRSTQSQTSIPVVGPALPLPAGGEVIGGNLREPRKVRDVKPIYPPAALASGVEGSVIVEAILGTEGSLVNPRVVRSIALLDQAVLDAVQGWRFTPTLLNGAPVPVNVMVTVTFSQR